jgi:carbon-monoxide dehydrogenase small subunit
MSTISLSINGRWQDVDGEPSTSLLDLLRERLGLMATKPGCDIGRCGACMVLLDGEPANACLLPLYRLAGRSVVTAEGLAALPEGRAVRAALTQEVAFQCGYCAPGMSIAATALLLRDAAPDEAAVREALSGNLCRCSGYLAIVRAVLRAPAELRRLQFTA